MILKLGRRSNSGSSSRLSSIDYSENPAFDHHAEKDIGEKCNGKEGRQEVKRKTAVK